MNRSHATAIVSLSLFAAVAAAFAASDRKAASMPVVADVKVKRVMPMNDDFRAPAIRAAAAGSSPSCCPTDLNCDGEVNGADLAILLSAWGPCPSSGSCPADFNANGSVDGADLATLLATWGPCVG